MDIESTALFERVQYTEPLNVNNNSDAIAFCIYKIRDDNLDVYNKAKVTFYTNRRYMTYHIESVFCDVLLWSPGLAQSAM